MSRWLQSAGLQHLASPLTSADNRALTTLVMQGYGGQSAEEKQKLLMLFRNLNFNGESGLEPYTTSHGLGGGGSSSFHSSELRGEFGAGLLDLHSIDDTELFSEHIISESFEPSPFMPSTSLDDEFGAVAGNPQKGLADSGSRLPTAEREHSGKENNISKIKVVVRKRPLNKKEISRREDDVVTVNDSTRLTVHEPKLKVDLTAYVEKHEFCFDSVLSEDVTNDEVYRITVEPIISAIFQQTKATCFAYGQTGSGKTFTMQPLPLRASEDMLRLLHQPIYRSQKFKMWLSYFEIYGGKLYDLLSDRRKLCMREDGRQQVCIVGLQEFEVSDTRIVREYIEKGNAARSTGSTGANEESSRSHAILQLVIKKHIEADGSKRRKEVNETKNSKVIGKISFIDLAGSERGADTTDNDRQTRIEGAEINKSLLALKECIRALDNDQIHIPFRGSKLTEVLRDSFVGNSRTVMISCISPNAGSCEHTLNTLRYADRVKSLSRSGNPKKDQPSTSSVSLGKEASPAQSFPLPAVLEDMHEQNQEPVTVEVGARIPEPTPAGSSSDFDGRLTSAASSYLAPGREERGATSSSGDRVDVKHVLGYQAAHDSYSAQNQEENRVPKVSPPRRKASRQERSEKQGTKTKRDSGLDFPAASHKQQQQQQQAPIDYETRNSTTRQHDEDIPYDEVGINAILEEEEALIAAHRKEIEDTMEIVREEMKLLAEVDQPGSLIDDYVTRLNYILSRKVAGLVGLQARLTRFQHRLKEQDILSSRRKVHH